MPTKPLLFAAVLFLVFSHCEASNFSYSYQNVFDVNADSYITGQQNIRKYTEWQDPAVTYWGPIANDVPAVLTSTFNFAAPTSDLFLRANLVAANAPWRGDYGASSLWGSSDGTNWQLLLDCPTPASSGDLVVQEQVYNQQLPLALLGTTQLWLQVRLQEHAALTEAPDPRATWADAQFSRWNAPGEVTFELDATLVPEPATASLVAIGVFVTLGRRIGCHRLQVK